MPDPNRQETKSEEEAPPKVPENWDRCHAYLKRKRKFCRQQPLPSEGDGPRYCGNHRQLLPGSRKRRRVPCPVDPSHLIFEDMIDKHVPICPKTTQRMVQQSKPFFKRGLNTGGHGSLGDPSGEKSLTFEQAKALAKRVLHVFQLIICGRAESETTGAADLVYDDIRKALPVLDLSSPELKAGLSEAISERRIRSGGPRHLHQQASLVGHLRRIGALESLESTTCGPSKKHLKRTIVELGAGRGIAGLIAAGVSAGAGVKTKLILVERGSSRGKADKVLRNVPKDTKSAYPLDLQTNIEWERVHCDIAHVDTSSIVCGECDDSGSQKEGQLVAVAKHLCGVGTDLALRSLEPIKEKLSACIFATCCHGACSWPGYVGRDYLRTVMEKDTDFTFGGAEFELMRKWSAGSVRDQESASRPDSEEEEDDEHGKPDSLNEYCEDICANINASSIGIARMVEALSLKCGARGLGRACQRLIDYGRREYMENVLFPNGEVSSGACVEMMHYVSDKVTPQNAALIAYRKPPVVPL